MSTKPSLPQHVGLGLFLTVLALFLTYGRSRGTTVSLEFLGFVLAFSAVHTSIAYLMIRQWVAYANREDTTSRTSGTAIDE